jgi:uncharacterized protein (DUF4415 family)
MSESAGKGYRSRINAIPRREMQATVKAMTPKSVADMILSYIW